MQRAAALVEHYQNTFELTFSLWRQRNRLFVTLIAVVAGAVIVTYAQEGAVLLLESLIVKHPEIKDGALREHIREVQSFTFNAVIAMLMLGVTSARSTLE